MRLYRANRNRIAVSEAIGAVLAIAVTLIAGTAAWSFARNQAGASESALQTNFGSTNNFLNEHFEVTDMYYSTTTATGGSCTGGNYCSVTFWLYNTGTLTLSVFSVRLYDSAGLVNLFYNQTQSGTTITQQVYDLGSSLSTKCKTAAASYESPALTTTTTKATTANTLKLTIPGTLASCPSFGQTFSSGTTYTVVVTGLYGNVIKYFAVK